MSETAQTILEGLKGFLKPRSRFFDSKKPGVDRSSHAPVAVDPHGYRLGVNDEFEILERAEETWLWTYAPDLINQRRLQRNDRFWIRIPGYDQNAKTKKLWLGNVLTADGACRYYSQKRALLELRQHWGRKIWLTNTVHPESIELLMGYEQEVTISRHGLAWIEAEEEIDTQKFVYPIAVFQ